MGPSPTLVRAGLRTPARPTWRSGAAQSVAAVAAAPSFWLLGALGFLARGGALLLLAAVLVRPSPVALRLMVGDNLTSSGFAPNFYILAGLAGATLVAVAMAALLVTAQTEVAAFARLTGSTYSRPRAATAGVFAIQILGLAALAAAALPLVAGTVEAAYAEIVRPSLGGPLYDRVLAHLGGPLFLLLTVLVLVEAASAVATRRLLAGEAGLQPRVGSPLKAVLVGLGRPILRPLATLGTALAGWLVTLAVLVPALWVLGLAFGSARGALLAMPPSAGGEEIGALVAVLLLCAVWLAALACAGLASAVRAALWTSSELR